MTPDSSVPDPGTPGGETSASPSPSDLRRVLDAAGVALATLDAEGHVVSANSAFATVFGTSVGGVVDTHLIGLCSEEHSAEVLAALVRVVGLVSEVEVLDLRLATEDGRAEVVRLTFGAVASPRGGVDHVLCVAKDVTSAQRAERRRRRAVLELTRTATEDADSGLPNLLGFDALLASALRRSARTGYPFSLLRCDLDGLGEATERYGRSVAQSLVEVYAARLAQRLRPSDMVCRAEGDTFLVIAEDLGDEQDAAGVAYRLLSSVVEPVLIEGREISLPLTIGIVVADGAASAQHMVDAAEQALEAAREDGFGGFRIIDIRSGLAA
ncbi:MAG: diguanylate cyclase domain-containing protein [Microthrixaceae bacterium]